MSARRLLSLAAVAAVLLGGTARAEEAPEDQAQKAAEAWLKTVDAGQYAQSWVAAADVFKSAVTKEQWQQAVGAARGPLGALVSRTLKSRQLTHTLPGLRADPQHIIRLAAEDMRQLGSVAIRVGGGQIDLVEDRDDPEIFFQSQVQVGQRLRLDALRGVHQQHRTLACFQCAGYLVGEIDVPGGVDQVQDMIDAADAPG